MLISLSTQGPSGIPQAVRYFFNSKPMQKASFIHFWKSGELSRQVREDTHKKSVFFSGGPLRFYVVHVIFFQSYNSLKRILTTFFLSNFWAKKAELYRKKMFFAKWSSGFSLPTPLVVRPLKKTFYLCLPLVRRFYEIQRV